jgi:hypothetical protein
MKGFIEVTNKNGPRKELLVAIDIIEAIISQIDNSTVIVLREGQGSYTVSESYEEVKRRLNSLFI